ncbi:MAG TPA: LPXTG cell wall anchor domain-containing protein [Candidatus Saccharimonadia bacterium]|nr:LPXTG cell wall anchor domain-containing protein [Candidatus Saccharimonadia bacterium]
MLYGKGSGTVLGAATGGAAVVALPQTGANTTVQIALAVAAGLAVWAAVYVARAKFSQR